MKLKFEKPAQNLNAAAHPSHNGADAPSQVINSSQNANAAPYPPLCKYVSNKPFHNLSYQRHAALAWPYRLLFKLRTTSHCPPSLLKSLGSSKKTGSPLGISDRAKEFVKSILWLCKPRIHYKINTKLTVAHWNTVEYEFRGSGYSILWTPPLTQYRALNPLITQSGFLLYLKDHVPGSTLRSATEFIETISHVSLLIRVWISSPIALKCSSVFSHDKASIYFGLSGSWLWDLRTYHHLIWNVDGAPIQYYASHLASNDRI